MNYTLVSGGRSDESHADDLNPDNVVGFLLACCVIFALAYYLIHRFVRGGV